MPIMFRAARRTAALTIIVATVHGCTGESATSVTAPQRNEPPKQLTILTPHSVRIREAFEIGFNSWRARNKKPYCRIDWITMGTPNCVDYVNAVFTLTRDDKPRKIPDLLFGGGVQDHVGLAERGYCVELAIDETVKKFPAEVGGQPTHDARGRWFATGLSSFGITFNERLCEKRGKVPPRTWADLADPRFAGWVGVAHPRSSGTTQRCLSLILQKHGWAEGWPIIARIFANSRGILARSVDVLEQVSNGIFLAGMAVNFDGLELAGKSNRAITFLNPPGASALSPDVISLVRCSKDRELAEEFVRFCLMEEGQVLWGVKSEFRGSYSETLYHYPIDPAVYSRFEGKLAVPDNPLAADFGLKMDLAQSAARSSLLILMADALEGDNHILLQEAWQAAIEAGSPTEAVTELTRAPLDEAAATKLAEQYAQALKADPEQAVKLRQELAGQIEAQFRGVLRRFKK